MLKFTDIDFNAVWQETFGWNATAATDDRKFNDQVESDFWVQLAPRYTQEYNLNHDTGLIAAKLASFLGQDKTILEIGCGSGNFTLLMAQYSRQILGLDFSPAMLQALQQRLNTSEYKNITLQPGKWEDFATPTTFDYIVSVNSLYRIRDIKDALLKMHTYSTQGFIIVRTIQRPFFYSLYQKNNLPCHECLDYQLLPLLLWRLSLSANVEFLDYPKTKHFVDLDAVQQEMRSDLGDAAFAAASKQLLAAFTAQAQNSQDGLAITQPRTTVIISVQK
ncbi:class I SAM-dependent methyltransferase [uncultured Phascolarctobacterium sp.]|uniref:class I SAM-dependent methyltransferase n=1 Tax=uncultured Phascolarctobacterium sp. TaxID=512296 RepID=UPI0025E2EFCF|nr:class I SAM-dependent methyltransferase [uncultured Phascolarctobacterium sp.]